MSTLDVPPTPSKLIPQWPAPENIVAFTSERTGGVSQAPYKSLNLGYHVDDRFSDVTKNRELLINSCEGLQHTQWLNQVHSERVVRAPSENETPDADACITREKGVACAIMTADCLPLLICDKQGQEVGAVHAGWRGLVSGVIENTINCFSSAPEHLMVWLGPAISSIHFEVGAEVREAFLEAASRFHNSLDETQAAFIENEQRENHFFADLYQLARVRLHSLGINNIYGGDVCCYANQQQFFSYRRERITGRMVSLIYKKNE